MPVEDYPQLPDVPSITGTIPSQLFAEAISQVAVAAGKDDTLPMLTGVRVEIEGNSVVLAATDRFRLAVRELQWEPSDPRHQGRCSRPGQDAFGECQDRRRGGYRRGLAGFRRRRRHRIRRHPGHSRRDQEDHHASARRRVPEVPSVAARQPHRGGDHRQRSADRGDPPCRAGRRAGAPRSGWSSPRDPCCSPPVATKRARPRKSCRCRSAASR